MVKYDSYKDLVKLTLESEYDARFNNETKISYFSKEAIIDFSDLDKGIFVELIPSQKKIDYNFVQRRIIEINEIVNLNSKSSPSIQVIVFSDQIENFRKNEIARNLSGHLTDTTLVIYDIKDIEKLSYSNSIDFKAFQKPNTSPKETVISKYKNQQLFLAGHSWGKEDQMPRFLENSIWENGHDRNDTKAVDSADEGQLIFIKSTYSQNGKSFLRIKGVGLVVENLKDGHTLRVIWSMFDEDVNIEQLGKYRRTFQRVMPKDRILVLTEVLKKIPNFDERISQLETIFKLNYSKDKTKNVSFENDFDIKYKSHRFIRDVLNKTFSLNLVIELSSVLYGSSLDLDLTDDNAKSYAVLLKKENFSDVPTESGFKPGSKNDRIMSNIYSKITNDVDLLLSGDAVNKYFTFFDESFSMKDIVQIKGWLDDRYTNIIEILRLSDVLKMADKHNVKYSDYLIPNSETNEKENSETIKTKDKIPFHLDNVETIDKLNREPVAKSLARLINNEIFDQEDMNHSFMVHLQGEWGSGKSTFLNLIEKHLETEERKWLVVKYNAWQNQHISPPWWSFIDQIFRQGKKQLHWFTKRPIVWGQEKMRRWIWYSAWQKIASLGIFIFLLIVIGLNHKTVFTAIGTLANLGNKSNDADILKFILSIASVIGLVFSLAKFISTPLAMQSSEQAKRFTLRASDPMNRIKEHFNGLLNDFNKQGFDIAVFIDDIDRCNRQYTVELLEGIQTLFKERKVLYIVAGDTKWITSCFENNYQEFAKVAADQGQNLGELFLEKAFQLSVRMPDVSEESKQGYWKEIIGDTPDIQVELEDDGGEMTNEEREEIKREIVEFYNQNENSSIERNLIQEKYNISNEQVTDLAIEGLDENTEDVRHLLMSFHNLISPNPRSIKRLANNYSMYRNTLIAEQADFKPEHLFRWLLLEDKYPALIKVFLRIQNLNNLDTYFEKFKTSEIQKSDIDQILNGRENYNEDRLNIDELTQILRK